MKKLFKFIREYNIFRIIYVYVSGIIAVRRVICALYLSENCKTMEEAERIYKERQKLKEQENRQRNINDDGRTRW